VAQGPGAGGKVAQGHIDHDVPSYVSSRGLRRGRSTEPRADVWDPLGVELNADIIARSSAREVLAVFTRRGAQFGEVNVVTALHRVARLADGENLQGDSEA